MISVVKNQFNSLLMSSVLVVLTGIFTTTNVHAQHLEVGALLGTSLYEGDLSKSSLKGKIEEMNLAAGILARYSFNDYFVLRGSLNYGKLTGADDGIRADRNLSFLSNVYELGVMGEVNILGYQPYGLYKVFSPYAFGGIAVFKFNPKAFYEGQTVALQPLGTEGQGLSDFPERDFYKLTQFAIPFGGGIKYALNDKWNIGLEVGLRFTFSDYIDDVSKTYPGADALAERGELAIALSDRSVNGNAGGAIRGNDGVNDYYIFSGIIISYNFLDNGLVGSRRRTRRKTGCPTF